MKPVKFIKITLLIFFISISGVHAKNSTSELYEKLDLFSDVLEKIKNEYVDE